MARGLGIPILRINTIYIEAILNFNQTQSSCAFLCFTIDYICAVPSENVS